MRRSTLLILLIVALILAAYLASGGPAADGDDPTLGTRLLRGFERERVVRIQLTRAGGAKLVLRRVVPTERWTIEGLGDADAGQVERLLAAVEFAELQRRVDEPRHQRLGLRPPRARLELQARGATTTIAFGADDPSGQGVYVEQAGTVAVIDNSLIELLLREPDGWRDRRLVRLQAGEIERAERVGRYRLVRDGERWTVTDGTLETLAAPAPTRRLLAAVAGLRARSFAVRAKAAGARLRVTGRASGEGRGPSAVELDLGGRCPGRADRRLVTREGSDRAVTCVDAIDLEPIEVDATTLRDRRLLGVREAELSGVEMVAGARRVRLVRDGARWRLNGAGGQADGDDRALAQWLDALRAVVGELEPAPTAQLAALARSPGKLVLTLEGGAHRTLRWGAPRDGRLPLRRDDEQALLWVAADVAKLLEPDDAWLRFRARALFELSEATITSVSIERGGRATEAVVRDDEGWRATRPAGGSVDVDQLRRLLARLATLRARRFVRASRQPTPVAIVLGARSAAVAAGDEQPPRTFGITLGARADGSCVGRTRGAGQLEFELAPEDCVLLLRPIVR